MKSAKEIISSISDNLFINEPLMFDIFCSHKLVANNSIDAMFRTGKGRIEYNPNLVVQKYKDAPELLKDEILRILLKHPYERVPENPNRIALKVASDKVLEEIDSMQRSFCPFKYSNVYKGLSYEEYYKNLQDRFPKELPKIRGQKGHEANESEEDTDSEKTRGDNCEKTSKKDSKVNDDDDDKNNQKKLKADFEASELWADDEEMCGKINSQIQNAIESNKCGSFMGSFLEKILANKKINVDYKRILSMFRCSMLSDIRKLTRLRPNRRYGFDYMGSKHKTTYSLLIAVDSSGSIAPTDLENFFSVINQFFKYDISKMKVIVFDVGIQQELDFKKAQKEIKVSGRGGTDFQAAIDYYENSRNFDGMIVFTDGYALKPKINKKKRILWFINDKNNYKENAWLGKLPGCKITYLP
ncbi:MAG: VWA-like domain-containing protein [Treponema sp.]|nr:VWA-like domain-containing protein [Treponema sp.]